MCDGRIFSIFSGISFVTLCTIDSLNLLGMPSFLFISFMGRGGVGVVCLLLLLHSWIGSHLWIGFVGLILTASCAACDKIVVRIRRSHFRREVTTPIYSQ